MWVAALAFSGTRRVRCRPRRLPMTFPLYNKDELLGSPSGEDGLDTCLEKRLRNSYCDLISGAGAELKLPQYVIACAIFLCHHFFAVKSMRRNDRFLIATACLYLGSKVCTLCLTRLCLSSRRVVGGCGGNASGICSWSCGVQHPRAPEVPVAISTSQTQRALPQALNAGWM